jgi:hypothetical protein
MASQEKHYIELSDILALRCLCECGTVLSLPLKLDAEYIAHSLMECPGCRKKWLDGVRNENRNKIVSLASDVQAVIAVIGSESDLKFDVCLEIAPDPDSADKESGKG